MNDAMASRVEALAFQYVGLGLFTVVNNLWTLVAVVTAAVSVWSIRAATGSSTVRRRHQPRSSPPCGDGGSIGRSDGCREQRPADAEEESAPAAVDDSSAASTSADYPSSGLGDGVTKGRRKFTTYYKEDGRCEAAAAEVKEEEEEAGEGSSCGGEEWWESWERVLKVRNGEMSWYRCQDTGVINGAVVRLWDEKRCGSGRMDGARCAVW
ncbi:uncharacterized protein LOC115741015 [Rhodamnia argentea]|uniref:Uncharacterized protein LOC115741015 n=1 Tax=Rhodamnia argentea TaxID=178133 RepID=A0A8B8P729_9MYRT|nr:uncharacterized protein LOC115741015 [Rhodamnia argentea]